MMRVYDQPQGGFVCPLCGNNDERPVVLIGVHGTEEGFNMEALQTHLDCLASLRYVETPGGGMVVADAPFLKEARA